MTTETVKLEYPFTHQGTEYDELNIRRPKMRDMKKAQQHKDDMVKSINMMADLCEVTPAVIEELDTADFQTVSDKVGEFMGVSADQTP